MKSRWLLRSLLGTVLGTDPANLEISEDGGKPFLAGADGPQFSLSRSGDWVAIAIGSLAIGIDIEVVKTGGFDRDVADVFFHPVEIEWIVARDEPDRSAAFYNFWTQKEAFVKGVGVGLAVNLTRVSVQPGGGNVTGRIADVPVDVWHTHVLDAGTDAKLALATPFADPEIEWIAPPQP